MNNNGASTFSTVPSIQSTSLNYSRTIPSSSSALSLIHLNSTHLNTFILFVCSWWCSSFRRYPKLFFFSKVSQVVLSSSFNFGIMQIYLVNKLCWRTFTRGWIKIGWRNNTASIGPASTWLSGCACCCFSYTVIYLLYMCIYSCCSQHPAEWVSSLLNNLCKLFIILILQLHCLWTLHVNVFVSRDEKNDGV